MAKTNGVVYYGFDPITIKVYKKDEESDLGILPPHPSDSDPPTDVPEPVTFPSLDSDDSQTSLPKQNPSLVDEDKLSDMETDDCFNKLHPLLLSEDEFLESSSDSEALNTTVVEASLPNCSTNAAVSPD